MPGNTIGKMFQVTTYGESHGVEIGCIIDGCPPNMNLTENDIQHELDRRKPGSKLTSQRRELDQVKINSGIFDGKTTGTPIHLCIQNLDHKTSDYKNIVHSFRPGHGDYTYQKKYGIRDYRGGGRASARETAARVAAGAVAKKILSLSCNIKFNASVTKVGEICAKNQEAVSEYINYLRKQGDSIGSEIKLTISNVPVGLGEPVFDKLDAELAYALMGINAVKSVEIGDGKQCVTSRGSEFRDEMNSTEFFSNHSGGILAGISTGQDIVVTLGFKPASSIRVPGKTIDIHNNELEIVTNGRHDPCVGLRAPVIVEAMAAIIICDHYLRNRGQNGNYV